MHNILIKFIKRVKNFGDFDLKKQMKREKMDKFSQYDHYHYHHQINLNLNNNNNNEINIKDLPPPPPTATTTKTTPKSSSTSMFVIKNYFLSAIWCWLKQFHAIGIFFALCSVLFWSFNGLSYKLNPHLHALEILMISSLFVSITYLGFMFAFYGVRYRTKQTNNNHNNNWTKSSRIEPFDWSLLFGVPGERISLIMRCLCGTISLACFYSSYRYIPLGDATTIRFTSPVFIAIFAHFIVNEPFGLLQIVNALTTLIGVILIGRPSFIFGGKTLSLNREAELTFELNDTLPIWPIEKRDLLQHNRSSGFDHLNVISSLFTSDPLTLPEELNDVVTSTMSTQHLHSSTSTLSLINDWSSTLFGVFLSLIAAISISISMIFMRKIRKTPPPLVIFWFSLSNVILGAVGLWIIDEYRMPIGFECWLLIIMTTFCTGLDQFFITLALKMENAGAVAVIQALCVVLSFIFSILILHEPLYWTSALGGTFIFFSVLVLGFSKLLQETTYSGIKSTIFAINILHSNSKKFNLDDTYRKLSTTTLSTSSSSSQRSSNSFGDGMNNNNINNSNHCSSFHRYSQQSLHYHHHHHQSFNEPYLLRVAPILGDKPPSSSSSSCGICIQNTDH
ncbi:uncharacterized protein LOC124500138 [Dermatophagoides farinae]|uniref:uncharacterized protein LOC124500138 n=1 Tax=Dermatophagoides farinae TaxID=6954 RepID=UPI003F61A3A0